MELICEPRKEEQKCIFHKAFEPFIVSVWSCAVHITSVKLYTLNIASPFVFTSETDDKYFQKETDRKSIKEDGNKVFGNV